MRDVIRIVLASTLVFGALLLAAFFFTPEASVWYASLAKPSLAPPDQLLEFAWIALNVLMVLSFARVCGLPLDSNCRRWFFAFGTQLLLNALWCAFFFVFHALFFSVVVAILLWFAVAILTFNAWEIDLLSFWLLAPYAAWISFATVLTTAIWWLN